MKNNTMLTIQVVKDNEGKHVEMRIPDFWILFATIWILGIAAGLLLCRFIIF